MTAAAVAAAAITIGSAVPAHAATWHARRKLWLVKQNDLAVIGDRYAPDFRWVTCGIGTGGPYASRTGRCHHGQVDTFTSYWRLAAAIKAHHVGKGHVVLFDQENWSFTPKREWEHPTRYAVLVGRLCHAHEIVLVFTGVAGDPATTTSVYEAAAPYAYAVAVQTQVKDAHPRKFAHYARTAASALHAVNPHVNVIIGLATDAGGVPVPARLIVREYRASYELADGFWLNADQWAPPQGEGCAPAGCPKAADKFLREIHDP